jgi:hypothetical protein
MIIRRSLFLILFTLGVTIPACLLAAGWFPLTTTPIVPFTTPILGLGSTTAAPSTASTAYAAIPGAVVTNAWNLVSGNRSVPLAIPGTFSGLEVSAPSLSAWVSGSDTFSIYASASTGTSPNCPLNTSNPNSCFDHSNTMHVAAGATVAFKSVPSSPSYTNTTPAPFRVSVAFTGDNANEGIVFGGGLAAVSTSAINYIGVNDATSATESVASFIAPASGILDSLYVQTSAVPGTAASYEFTVFHNGVATNIVAGNNSTTCAGAASSTCNDTLGCSPSFACTHSVSVIAGDTISVQVCPSNATGCQTNTNAPAAVTVQYSMRWLPSIVKQAIVVDTPITLPASTAAATYYNLVNGSGNSTTTVTNNLITVPYTATAQTYEALTVGYCWSGSNVNTRTVSLQASAGSPTNSVVFSGTAACPSAGSPPPFTLDTSGSYTTSAPPADGTTINLKTVNGSPAPATLTQYKTSLVAVVN